MNNETSATILRLIDQHRTDFAEINSSLTNSQEEVRRALIFENRVAFSISEVAFMTNLSPRTIERMIRRGDLIVRRVGRRVLISRNELEAWLNRKE